MLQVVKVLVLSCLVNSAGNEEKREPTRLHYSYPNATLEGTPNFELNNADIGFLASVAIIVLLMWLIVIKIIISIFDVLPKAKITAFREAPPGDFDINIRRDERPENQMVPHHITHPEEVFV
ncbi:hypothetical protein L5515_009464 [Caenorhabditis briggsae]|uniref:Uncharacterized protein n=1 Tax=Caenorhabditis briggsae TaxID=6238 RepID=A0AAE9D2N7_CAEBR|nr:hypothetical protein L3Y34_009638 [Caenorhabditis briggsae]UMM37815.1 hypothetical protein L5515_009464 [Caenorhabditis briggsae]